MAMTLGSGNLLFEPVENWEKLPEGWGVRGSGRSSGGLEG